MNKLSEAYRLDLIEPNPWQPRQSNDPVGIEELAFSIARDGLMQIPVGRPLGEDALQLAIGHRRLEAFRLLSNIQAGIEADKIDSDRPALVAAVRSAMEKGLTFHAMPLDVQELTDRQMFEMVISENVQRKDLNPVELAAAMKRYMDEFHATSRQAGQFFKVNNATVRGTVRLLDLPDNAKTELAEGRITVGTARRLLTVQRVAPEKVSEAISNLANSPDPEDAIGLVLSDAPGVVKLWEGWRNAEVRAGQGLWLLNTPADVFTHLPKINEPQVYKAFGLAEEQVKKDDFTRWIWALGRNDKFIQQMGLNPNDDIAAQLIAQGAPADVIDRLDHLIHPPACTACASMAKSRNDYYCGVKLCHARKRKSYESTELERVSQETGIPVYDPGQDGKDHINLNHWSKTDGALYEERDPDLRLMASPKTYHNDFTKDDLVKVVLTGERAKKIKIKEKAASNRSGGIQDAEERDRRWKLEQALQKASERFEAEVVYPVFSVILKDLDNLGFLMALAQLDEDDLAPEESKKSRPRAEKLKICRLAITEYALANRIGWNEKKAGPQAVAEQLQGVAKTWGVTLPADWLEMAKRYMPEGVAVETVEKKEE